MNTSAVVLLVVCYLGITLGAWKCTEGPVLTGARQIDASLGLQVATDNSNKAYKLINNKWTPLSDRAIRHVTVGFAGIWAVDPSFYIYRMVNGNFVQVGGLLKQLDAGGMAYIVGANMNDNTFCLPNGYASNGGAGWVGFAPILQYYSCGPLGCWGVERTDRVLFNPVISGIDCSNSGWTNIDGVSMVMIEVGTDGSVFGVDNRGKVYQRQGVSRETPSGSSWLHVPMCLSIKHVSYDTGVLWAVSNSGNILVCSNGHQ